MNEEPPVESYGRITKTPYKYADFQYTSSLIVSQIIHQKAGIVAASHVHHRQQPPHRSSVYAIQCPILENLAA